MSGQQRHIRRENCRGRRKTRGQAVVEFALVMIFFLMILLVVLDLGRAFFTVVALENAAAEGALYGMANPTCETSSDCSDPNNIVYRARHESTSAGLLNPDDMQVAVSPPPRDAGMMIAVTVTYPFEPIIPLLSAFGADTIQLSSSARQLIP